MPFLRTNKRRKDGRQKDRWARSLSPERTTVFFKKRSVKWNTGALQVYLQQKMWLQHKVCLHKRVHMYKEIAQEVPELSLVFGALTRKMGWEERSARLSRRLDWRAWVKSHRLGWFRTSLTTGLCPALEPICEGLSDCLATFQGGRQKRCGLGFHLRGMNARSHFAVLMKCYLTWNQGSPLRLHIAGEKSRKQYFSHPKYEIITVILKSEKTT